MSHKTEPCDPQVVESFLNDRLDPEERAQFIKHLDECDPCQTALANEAAGADFWNETADLLGSGAYPDSSIVAAVDESQNSMPTNAIKTIVDWLSPTDDPEMLGRVGEYEISGVVGVGGMGTVLKGFDRSLLRVVAIKVMAPHLADNGSARIRFEREARAAAAISHDNVIDIYQVAEMNGLPYLVMPFARGPSLQKRIDEGGPLTTLEVVQVGRQIASGLAAAHEQGLVHRDIKPANILLNDGVERLLITDFGVASAMDDASMTQTGLIAGTPQFMSPEQARGEPVDQRSDLFSLGAVLYTICTGRAPFRQDTPLAVLRKITDSSPRPIREINPDIPEWLAGIIERLLEKESAARFENATQVSELLEKCLPHLRQPTLSTLPRSVLDFRPGHPTDAKVEPTQPNPLVRKMVGAALLLAVAVVSLMALLRFAGAPEITGTWQGDAWTNIRLSSTEEADWYSGTFDNSQGEQGAIHLEWSPLRRRFVGRWSVGTGNTGTIVMRADTEGIVRGAISLDAEIATAANQPRLRDFEWQPSEPLVAARAGSAPVAERIALRDTGDQTATERRHLILWPRNGTVKLVAPNIRNGEMIKQDQLIMEIEFAAPTAAKINLLETKLKDAETKVQFYSMNADDYTQARDFSVNSAMELANAAEAKYRSKIAYIPVLQAAVKQARNNLDRITRLADKGLTNQEDAEAASLKLEQAVAEQKSAESEAEMLKSEWRAKQLDVEERRRLAQAKIDYVVSQKNDALTQIAQLRQEIEDLESTADKPERISILAPFDGVVAAWQPPKIGDSFEEGERILELRRVTVATNRTRSAPNRNVGDSPQLHSIPAMMTLAADLDQRLRTAKSALVKHAREIEEAAALVAVGKAELESDQLSPENRAATVKGFEIQQERLATLEVRKTQLNSDLKAVRQEVTTVVKLLELEIESHMSELDTVQELASLKQKQYDQGLISQSDLKPLEMQVQKLEVSVHQLRHLLAHFNQIIAPKDANP